MPATCSWYDPEQTIILNLYEGDWTLNEHYANMTANYAMTGENPPARFDVIVQIKSMPNMNYSLSHGSRIVDRPRPNLGVIVMVTEHPLARALVQVLMKLNPQTRKHYRVVGKLIEAEKLILQDRDKAANTAGS
jgi:hypothetical protein